MLKTRLIAMIVLVAFCIMALFSVALAAGNYPWTKNKQLAPNVTAIAPAKTDAGVSQSGCVTTATTKGAIQGQFSSVAGFVAYETEVFTIYSSAATQLANPQPVMVMYEVDGVMMAIGHNFRFTNSGSNTYTRAVQKAYSSPKKRTFVSCVRRQ